MSPRLSKSRFQKGLQCEKALWLAIHRPELAPPVGESRQAIFDQGTAVGRLAQGLFPQGVEVTDDHLHTEDALENTARLLGQDSRPLYEPAFFFDGVLVRVDVLVPVGDGSWDLYEVKSTARVKPEHITDVAVQSYVVEGSGLRVRRSCVVHLNTEYEYAGGDLDLAELFAVEDVTDLAREFMPEVPAALDRFRGMLAGPEPQVRIGQRCAKPYECDFVAYCHSFLPVEHPITDLPRLSDQALHELLDAGVTGIRDIPDEYARLTDAQRFVVESVRAGEACVDVRGLAQDLGRLEWPVRHLDFETVNPALPLWPGTRPYEQVPFQYSMHVHYEDGSHEHREYLHVGEDDPRPALVEHLLADAGGAGTITHYTAYERTQLNALARAVPQRAGELAALMGRLTDLEPMVRRRTVHPDAGGRTSIKYVLPAWCPDLDYAELGISDGQTAAVRYLSAITGRLGSAETERTFRDLREYCGMDTYAMVRLLERLRELVG